MTDLQAKLEALPCSNDTAQCDRCWGGPCDGGPDISLPTGDALGEAEARGYAMGIRDAVGRLSSLATTRDAMKCPKAATSVIRQCAAIIETALTGKTPT